NPLVVLHGVVPDEDWEIPEFVPVQLRLQVSLLWHSAAEALGISSAAFFQRASHTALAQTRITLDAYCLARWLTAFEAKLTPRALGLALKELDDAVRLERHLPGEPERRAENINGLREFRDLLRQEAENRGDGIELPPPQTEQYDRWLHSYGV